VRPLLLLDVDGVLAPIDSDGTCAGNPDLYDQFTACGVALFKRRDIRELLARLGGFEIWWATMWHQNANAFLRAHFGLPVLPVLSFPEWDKFPTVMGSSVAALSPRVDDLIDPAAEDWGRIRNLRVAPTLLLRTDPQTGLDPAGTERLVRFAETCPRSARPAFVL